MAIEVRLNEHAYVKIFKIGTCPDTRDSPDGEADRWSTSSRPYFGNIEGLSLHTDCVKIETYRNDILERIEYDRGGRLHRENEPALIIFDKDGSVHSEGWFINGYWHRKGAPAWIMRENQYQYVYWKQCGEFHREDGPAKQEWNEDGTLSCSEWYWRGKLAEEWRVRAQATLPAIHALLPQPIAEEIVEQLVIGE